MKMKVSFWDFLKYIENDGVEIPLIQRDYAQGRKGEEFLRRNFLADIKKAFLPNRKVLELDFVYGSEENGRLQPLDGQQRLTTLWLLHWYIAYRAEKINTCAYTQEEIDGESVAERRDEMGKTTVADILKRFTYETRISSREFCENLSGFDKVQPEGVGLVEHIKNQTWFKSEKWKQDLTIRAMLNMLGGTEGDDGIENVFSGVDITYGQCWDKLISPTAPVVFYYLSLKDFSLSDDLYVKMNARGKPLTPFENFKAEMVGYLSRMAKKSGWEELYESIPVRLDNAWSDIFWKHRSKDDSRIDEIYFAFLERFFWNELVVKNLNDGDYSEYKDLKLYEVFKKEKENGDKSEGIKLDVFKNLKIILDNYSKYAKNKNKEEEIPLPKWVDFNFIPEYKRNDEGNEYISPLTQPQRVIFFALCKYFEEEDVDKIPDAQALERWMRVVCNLVSGRDRAGNLQIKDNSGIRMAIEYLEKLSRYTHNVLKGLDEQRIERDSNSFSFREKWNEEIIKAKKILKDSDWEAKIIEAENYSFFEGAIRFLYQKEIVEMVGEKEVRKVKVDWDYFDKKWENVRMYFNSKDEEENSPDEGKCWVEGNSVELLKALLSRFSSANFASVLLGQRNKALNNRASSWIYYLTNNEICGPVHQLLTLEDGKITVEKRDLSENFSGNAYDDTLYYLSQTKLLDRVIEVFPDSWIHYLWGDYIAIQRHLESRSSNEKDGDYVILNTDKYDFLDKKYGIIRGEESNEIEGTKLHFENSYICFDYENLHYVRWSDRFIYLQEGLEFTPDGHLVKDGRLVKNCEAEKKEDKYYCFDTRDKNTDSIIEGIKQLKRDYEKANPPSNS